MEVLATCDSACVDFVAKFPLDKVCVGPGASLGFHYATDDDTGRVVKKGTDEMVAIEYPAPLRNFWNKVKNYGHPLEIKPLAGSELRAIYKSCAVAKRLPPCGEQENQVITASHEPGDGAVREPPHKSDNTAGLPPPPKIAQPSAATLPPAPAQPTRPEPPKRNETVAGNESPPPYSPGAGAGDPICKDFYKTGCDSNYRDEGIHDRRSMGKKISETIMPRVREILTDIVRRSGLDPAAEDFMLSKLRTMHFRFNGEECRKIPGLGGPTYFLRTPYPGAPVLPNTLSFCTGSANWPDSEFLLAQIIGHEMSHSVDNCAMTMSGLPAYRNHGRMDGERNATGRFAQCLRSADSMHAQAGTMCPTRRVDHPDQFQEAYADYMGDEVVAAYMDKFHADLSRDSMRAGYGNIATFMCRELTKIRHPHGMMPPGGPMGPMAGGPGGPYGEDPMGGEGPFYYKYSEKSDPYDPHPPAFRRANFGIAVQPLIRRQMGCSVIPPEGARYCGPDGGTFRPQNLSIQASEVTK